MIIDKRVAVFSFMLLISCLWSSSVLASVSGNVQQGNKLYDQESFEKANEKYNQALQKAPESDIINFNAGSASYKAGDYELAADHFQKALLSDDPLLKEKAHYNLGNTFYRMAEQVGPTKPQSAVAPLEKSLAQYEEALKITADDKDVQFNYDFVKKVLEKVKQQIQQQQKQQKKQCDNPQQKKDGGNDKKQSGKGRQDQQQKSGKKQEQQSGQQEKEHKDQQQGDDSNKKAGERKEEDSQQQQQQQEGQEPQQQSGSPNQDQQQDGEQSGKSQQEQEDLSRREAQMRLNHYENNQEPKGMLNLRGQFDTRPVLKDW